MLLIVIFYSKAEHTVGEIGLLVFFLVIDCTVFPDFNSQKKKLEINFYHLLFTVSNAISVMISMSGIDLQTI